MGTHCHPPHPPLSPLKVLQSGLSHRTPVAPGSPHPVPLELLSIKTPPPSSPVPSVLCCLLPSPELLLGHECQLCVLGSLGWGDGKWGDGNPAGTAPLGDTGAAPSALWGLGGGGGVGGIAGMGTVEEMSTEGRRGDGDAAGMTAAVCRRVSSPQFPFTTARALPLLAAPWMPALQPHHSPPGRGGYGGSGRCSPPQTGRSQPCTGAPCAAPQPDAAPHKRLLFPAAVRGGAQGVVWAVVPRGSAAPSPSRPHSVAVPRAHGRDAALRQPAGTDGGGGGGGRGLDKARTAPCPGMSSRLPLPRAMRSGGVGSTGGAPMSHGHPSGICSCVGSQGPGGERSHQLSSTPKPDPPPASGPDPTTASGSCREWVPPIRGHRVTPLPCSSNSALHPWDPKRWQHQQLQALQPGWGERGQRPHSGGRRRAAKGTETAESSQKSSVLYFILQSQKELQGRAVRPTWVGDGGTHRWGHGTPSPALHPALQQSAHSPRAVGQAATFRPQILSGDLDEGSPINPISLGVKAARRERAQHHKQQLLCPTHCKEAAIASPRVPGA